MRSEHRKRNFRRGTGGVLSGFSDFSVLCDFQSSCGSVRHLLFVDRWRKKRSAKGGRSVSRLSLIVETKGSLQRPRALSAALLTLFASRWTLFASPGTSLCTRIDSAHSRADSLRICVDLGRIDLDSLRNHVDSLRIRADSLRISVEWDFPRADA